MRTGGQLTPLPATAGGRRRRGGVAAAVPVLPLAAAGIAAAPASAYSAPSQGVLHTGDFRDATYRPEGTAGASSRTGP